MSSCVGGFSPSSPSSSSSSPSSSSSSSEDSSDDSEPESSSYPTSTSLRYQGTSCISQSPFEGHPRVCWDVACPASVPADSFGRFLLLLWLPLPLDDGA